MHSAEITELISRYSCFAFLKNSTIAKSTVNRWDMTNSYFNYTEQEVYQLQAMFIGKTGYGKSTTLNKIVGRKVFQTSDISACTKDLYEATYRISPVEKTFFSLCDLPGVGESGYADTHYYEWYRAMLEKSHCVVYLLRADQRDFAVDKVLFEQMFKTEKSKEKVIIALNYADKIEPLNRYYGLSSAQIDSLKKKVHDVSKKFDMSESSIIYYSATDEINLDILVSHIAKKIKRHIIWR